MGSRYTEVQCSVLVFISPNGKQTESIHREGEVNRCRFLTKVIKQTAKLTDYFR